MTMREDREKDKREGEVLAASRQWVAETLEKETRDACFMQEWVRWCADQGLELTPNRAVQEWTALQQAVGVIYLDYRGKWRVTLRGKE